MSQECAPAADEPLAAECAPIAAEYDCSGVDLGPRDQWDPVVDVVRTLLETSAPMAYCRGAGPAGYAEVEPGLPLGIPGNRPVIQMPMQEGDAPLAVIGGLLQRHAQAAVRGRAAPLEALTTMPLSAARGISQHVAGSLVGDQGAGQECALLVVVHD